MTISRSDRHPCARARARARARALYRANGVDSSLDFERRPKAIIDRFVERPQRRPARSATGVPPMPEIRFRVAQWQDKTVLARMLELYQYDMSEFWPQDLNVHGEYGYIAIERYLRNPRLCAYLFFVDEQHAGFGLVDPDVSLPENEFWMGQFFVLKKYRRLGVGRQAARFIFAQHPGKWEVGQMPLNLPAKAFWIRTISDYTAGRFVEHELHDERWDGFLQCFDNSPEPAPP